MAIDELLSVFPPPAHPVPAGMEEQLPSSRFLFPSDYLEIGRKYGSGRFCDDYLEVFNPYDSRYELIISTQCDILRHIKTSPLRDVPYEIAPTSPGLLPWGRDEHGGMLCWLTKGNPESWTIVVKRRDDVYEEWHMPVTTFLAKAATNELTCILWTLPFPESCRIFTPVQE